MNINIYIAIRNFKQIFFSAKNIKILLELNLVDQVILNISSNYFFIFLVRIREIGKK